jgi:hypothetical protein
MTGKEYRTATKLVRGGAKPECGENCRLAFSAP